MFSCFQSGVDDVQPPARNLNPEQLTHLQSWIGNHEQLRDELALSPVRALSATLDREDPEPARGDTLPPLWHWLYFLPHHRQSEIGPDGHAKRGGFLPPVPLPRRMWAGGRLHFNPTNPLVLGEAVTRDSVIESVTHKSGRTGDLLFVVVNHTISNPRGMAITEAHDIVYRAAALPDDPIPTPTVAESNAPWTREITPDDVLLFRYSALTFNGHRIHYDRRYVTEVEGYPGLIVHGPLIATLLVDLVRRHAPTQWISGFQFKAVRPTFDLNPFRVNARPQADGRTIDVWANDHDGYLTMSGTVTLENNAS
jgi:3-methylfumaryl-CoA hydratase